MSTNLKSIANKTLIVGEGGRDYEFLTALCAKHQIEGNFQISAVDGNTTFNQISRLTILPGYDSLPGILLFGDNDEKANKSFKIIKDQLNDINFPSPAMPMRIARKDKHPPLAVAMMPFPDVDGEAEGCLETLLLPAIARAHPDEKACVDALVKCAKIDEWKTKSSRDKLRVRSILSMSCESNPMCGINEWYKSSANLIPLNDPVFSRLVEFLRRVPAWFASGENDWNTWCAANPR